MTLYKKACIIHETEIIAVIKMVKKLNKKKSYLYDDYYLCIDKSLHARALKIKCEIMNIIDKLNFLIRMYKHILEKYYIESDTESDSDSRDQIDFYNHDTPKSQYTYAQNIDDNDQDNYSDCENLEPPYSICDDIDYKQLWKEVKDKSK